MENDSKLHNEETIPPNLIIKLKLPSKLDTATKPEEQQVEQVEDNGDGIGVEEVKLHICPFCNMGFNSGKAKGGHISRAHNQSTTKRVNNSEAKLRNYPLKLGVDDDDDMRLFECDFCDKKFPSEKSLHGHMRSHPNRGFRGMNPPPGYDVSKVGDDVAKGEDDVAMSEDKGSLVKWRVTGKRGRRATSSPLTSTSSDNLDSFDEVVEAVETLLLLKRGKRDFSDDDVDSDEVERARVKGMGLMMTSSYNDVDVSSDFQLVNKGDDVEGKCLMTSSSKVNIFDEENEFFLKNLANYNDCGNDETIRVINHEPSLTIKGIKKVIRKANHKIKTINNNNNNDEIINKWVCTTCGKSFPTHQALGGHRSSHNKDKQNSTRTIGSGVIDIDSTEVNNKKEEHECKLCHKIFPTGQALGGHQRCHFVHKSESLSGQNTGQMGDDIRRLDLNLDPPMEDCE